VVSGHLGERLEANRTFLLRTQRLLLSQPDYLDDGLALFGLDGERGLRPLLQLLRLQARRQLLAFLVPHLDALVNLDRAILAVDSDDQDALLGIDFLDRAHDLKGRKYPGEDHECAKGANTAKTHEDSPEVSRISRKSLANVPGMMFVSFHPKFNASDGTVRV